MYVCMYVCILTLKPTPVSAREGEFLMRRCTECVVKFVTVSGHQYRRPLVSRLTCVRVWELVRGNVLVGTCS